MFSPLRNRFGIPGVISVIALVFAMFGGAYAASNSGDGPKATASAKKGPPGPRGKQGKPGKAGATGPAGPAGPQGPAGANGKDGSNGSSGSAGAAGKSVVSTPFSGLSEPAGEPCNEQGGTQLQVEGSATKSYACNGEKGEEGEEGTPWTAGGTLPPNATETGVWAFDTGNPGFNSIKRDISFNVPLDDAPEPVFVPADKESEPGCPGRGGGAFSEGYEPTIPQAAPGKLCVYAMAYFGVGELAIEGQYVYEESFEEFESLPETASASGAILRMVCPGFCGASGTWAVTAG